MRHGKNSSPLSLEIMGNGRSQSPSSTGNDEYNECLRVPRAEPGGGDRSTPRPPEQLWNV